MLKSLPRFFAFCLLLTSCADAPGRQGSCSPACGAGEVCESGTCYLVCNEDEQCALGSVCEDGTCRTGMSSSIAIISGVLGTGSPDSDPTHSPRRLRDRLLVLGENLRSATFRLTGTSPVRPPVDLERCADGTDEEVELALPSTIGAGDYVLTAVNQVGTCDAEVSLIKGEDAFVPTGAGMDFWGSAAPEGWVFASGGSIGNAGSGASERAHADCHALFVHLWNEFPDATCPVAGGRGTSAEADWLAGKTIATPDARGRATVGTDAMGGSGPAGRMTTVGSGIDGAALGAAGGSQTHTLSSAEMPGHVHSASVSDPGHDHSFNYLPMNGTAVGGGAYAVGGGATQYVSAAATGISVTIGSSGGGAAHPNTQPSIMVNKIIKL